MSFDETKALARAAIGTWSPGELDRAGEICGPGYVMRQHHDWDVMGMLQQLGAIRRGWRRPEPAGNGSRGGRLRGRSVRHHLPWTDTR